MSSNQSTYTSSSSFSFSSSSSSSTQDGQTTGYRQAHSSYTGPSGETTTRSAHQNLGGTAVQETKSYDAEGRELMGGSGASGTRKIEEVSDEQQAQRDREYEERMEDEYAKREGGA